MHRRRAYSYIRFSSDKQSEGSSLQRQLKAASEYAEKHGLELDTSTYRDLGVSAFRGRNAEEGALRSFLDAVEAKLVPTGSVLIVENMDRLSRDHVDIALGNFMSIIGNGISIVTLTDPPKEFSRQTIRDSRGFDVMWAIQDMVRAHEESARKRDFAVKKWDERRASDRIMTTRCPPWMSVKLDANGNKVAFVLDTEKVKIVQRIYELALEGWGVQRMAKLFNEEKVPRLKDAAEWRAQEFVRILKWEATMGTLVSREREPPRREKHRKEGYYPQIIDPKDWARVQSEMKSRSDKDTGAQGRKGANVDNLFSRLMRCGVCGAGLRLTSRDRVHLMCLRAYSGGNCSSPRHLYEPIEREILQLLLLDEEVDPVPQAAEPVDTRAPIRAAIEEKQQRFARYLEDFETLPNNYLVKRRMNDLTAEIAVLEKELAEWVPPMPVRENYERAAATWQQLLDQMLRPEEFTQEQRRELRLKLQAGLRTLITRINVLPRLHRHQLPTKYENRTVWFTRQIEVIGPIVDVLRSSKHKQYELTKDGALVSYRLPSYGYALTAREKEWQAQTDADIKAMEEKFGIETGLVDETPEEKKPAARKRRAGSK